MQAGVKLTLDSSAEILCWSNALAEERKGIDWCMCELCRVKEGLSSSEQPVRYFDSAPPLGVAYCLAKPGLALIQLQPEEFATSICTGSRQCG